MTDYPIRDAGHIPHETRDKRRSRHLVHGWLTTWLGAWRAAAAAEDAYSSAKAHGAPRDIAAGQAFDALAATEYASGDGGSEELARRLVDTGHGEAPRRLQRPLRELDCEVGAAADAPHEDARVRGELRVAALCLAIIAAIVVLGFAASSTGTRGPT